MGLSEQWAWGCSPIYPMVNMPVLKRDDGCNTWIFVRCR